MYVANVSCGCCKVYHDFICCNGYTLQASVLNVSVVLNGCCTCFYLGVAYVSHLRCKCFIRMLHMFSHNVAGVSSRCCICFPMATHVFPSCFTCMLQVFQLFQTYVANVSSRCCKSRSGVHTLQWIPSAAATCACTRVGVEVARAASTGERADVDRDGSRHGTRSGHRTRSDVEPHVKHACTRGHPDASSRPDVSLSLFLFYINLSWTL
jgi:hypothetical protein